MRYDLAGDTFPPEGPRFQPAGPYVRPAAADPWAQFGLTKREGEVARLLALGTSNKGIAAALSVQVQTIKRVISRILEKTESDNRTMAALKLSHTSPNLT